MTISARVKSTINVSLRMLELFSYKARVVFGQVLGSSMSSLKSETEFTYNDCSCATGFEARLKNQAPIMKVDANRCGFAAGCEARLCLAVQL